MAEQLRGVVERITYQNEQNGYSVIRCAVKGRSELVTVVGNMPEVHVGSVLAMEGSWSTNPRYGTQFHAVSIEETLPATAYGIEKYLGSGLVKGIGPAFAGRIVRRFGADTLRVIEEEPDRLLEVEGIGSVRVERIKKSWADQREIKNIMLFLQGHDVSTSHAVKIFRTYGNESLRIVQENPYRLADDIWGIGFKTADTIASKLGFGPERPERLRSGLLYSLNRLSDEGHCFAAKDDLIRTGEELLGVSGTLLGQALAEMIAAEDVKTEPLPADDAGQAAGPAVYLPALYHSEAGIARRLREIWSDPRRITVRRDGLQERIGRAAGIRYDAAQTAAVLQAVSSKILVLTGGPGTGKTTTTLGILTAFREAGAEILLAAPTGRAAKRLSEAAGLEAKTIHRLLEFKPPEGYQRNAQSPLEGDVLIVDECSMIDAVLMYSLLRAVPDSMTLILVGDTDQLPSVGAGNVLRDVIDSGVFPVVRLTRIFRQAQQSRIIMNAHRINRGKMPDISNGRSSDFFFLEQEDPETAAGTIVDLVQRRLPKRYGIRSSGIQVLTPMQRGAVGAAALNRAIQEAVNPNPVCLRRGGVEYREGDKVMQIRNNYTKEVFNGDIGTVRAVYQEDRELVAEFDGRSVVYEAPELDELVLAYAATIHKSQGSEYPVVVMPVLMTHYIMLQRNLLYTGVTRAKKLLVIVGSKKALALAVRNVTARKRNTLLAQRIRQAFAAP